MRGVSVVICTYNGSRVITLALEALSQQSCTEPAEIILVDNNSSDGVADIAERYWASLPRQPFPLKAVREEKPGLAFARRAGVFAASHDIIVFCDDDNLLAPDYLTRVSEGLADPRVGAVGGGCVPKSDRELPPFFYAHALKYAVGTPALDSGPVDSTLGWLFGAGLAARRADLLTIYEKTSFPNLTGRVGSSPGASGDDVELCYTLRLLGGRLVYDERLRFTHFIEHRKLAKDYIKTLQKGMRDQAEVNALYEALLDLEQGRGARQLLRKTARFLVSRARGKPDPAAAFWLLAFGGLTPLMNEAQARIFDHYQKIRRLRPMALRTV